MPSLKHPYGIPSLILAVLLFVLGGVPLLATLGIIGFNLPAALLGLLPKVAMYIFAGAGLYLIIEDLAEGYGFWDKYMPMILGFLFLGFGVVNILSQFGVIGLVIPGLPEVVYLALFLVEGVALIFGAFY